MMKKPDFNNMTLQELRAYILSHREDDDAIEVLISAIYLLRFLLCFLYPL